MVIGGFGSSATLKEMLTAAIQRDTPDSGYKRFHFGGFGGLDAPLEESLVERFTERLTNVEDFKVDGSGLPAEVRCQFIDLAAEVIELHESQMTHIHLDSLNSDKELTESDNRLVELLCNSGWTSLSALSLRNNHSWWSDATVRPTLLAFMQSQTALVTLNLGYNSFSSKETEELLLWLHQSSNRATL